MSVSPSSSISAVNLAQAHMPPPIQHDKPVQPMKPAPAVAAATNGAPLRVNVLA